MCRLLDSRSYEIELRSSREAVDCSCSWTLLPQVKGDVDRAVEVFEHMQCQGANGTIASISYLQSCANNCLAGLVLSLILVVLQVLPLQVLIGSGFTGMVMLAVYCALGSSFPPVAACLCRLHVASIL